MSIWSIILILLVIGMMAWPLLLLKPSKAEQQRAERRLKLIEQGIKIQVTPPQLPAILQREYNKLLLSIGFSQVIANSLLQERYLAIRNPHSKEWFWPEQKRPPAALLENLLHCYKSLPDWCLAVEQGPVNSTIFALESQIDPSTIKSLLHALNQCIIKNPIR
jgi:hypothetical protein